MPLTKPGNKMEPFSASCKSLEVIQNPRGVVSQARINAGVWCLPLKQRRHLELFCGYSVRTWRAERYCFRLSSVNSPQLPNPLGCTVKLARTLNFITLLHGIYLSNASLAVRWHREGVRIRGAGILWEYLVPVRKSSSVKRKGRKKERKSEERNCLEWQNSHVYSLSFSNIKILTNTNYMLFMRFSWVIPQKISTWFTEETVRYYI